MMPDTGDSLYPDPPDDCATCRACTSSNPCSLEDAEDMFEDSIDDITVRCGTVRF